MFLSTGIVVLVWYSEQYREYFERKINDNSWAVSKEIDSSTMPSNTTQEEPIPPGEEDTNRPNLQFARKGIDISIHRASNISHYSKQMCNR